jgi:small-conductance mechanosensitive channel
VFETDETQPPELLDQAVVPFPSQRESTRARRPGDDSAVAEVARLRRRVSQQDEALIHMAQALLRLRRGGDALRDENRELRMALAAAQRTGAGG